MGVISDIVNMGVWMCMCMWGMVVGVVMIGFYVMGWLGWIDISKIIYFLGCIIWLLVLVGGVLFGFGMVLVLGCGSKMLVCIGVGSFKFLVVFFVMGFVVFVILCGVLVVVWVNMLD